MLCRIKRFLKIDDFQGFFFNFSGTLVRFSIQINDFGIDFYKISLSSIIEAG